MPSLSCRRLLLLSVYTLILLATEIFAQQKVDCAKFHSQGCHSFNESVDAKDKDILEQIGSKGNAARVCFAEDEDNFSVLSYGIPFGASQPKSKDELAWSHRRYATFRRYEDGISGEFFLFRITWQRGEEEGDWSASGEGLRDKSTRDKSTLDIWPNEILLTASYTNKSHTITNYNLSIRVATGRFKETYSSATTKGQPVEMNKTGYCVRYENGLAEAPHPQ